MIERNCRGKRSEAGTETDATLRAAPCHAERAGFHGNRRPTPDHRL